MVDESSDNIDVEKSGAKRDKPPKKTEPRARSGVLVGGLALSFAVIALIGAGFLWYTLFQQRALLSTDVVGELDRLKDDTKLLKTDVNDASATLDDVKASQDGIREALEKIQNDLSRHRTEWALAEAEQLLVIANNRLQLARDVRSALAALRAADSQLNQLSNPTLLPVRREIAREIATLEALDKVDIGGISLKLGSLAESVERLPVAPDVSRRAQALLEAKAPGNVTDAPTTEGSWRAEARSVWRDMVTLVRIRHDVGVQRPLLPPEQEYFLRENLKLMLYGAQTALLQGNIDVFQQDVKVASQLLKDYFDPNTQVVIGMQAELEKMRASKLVAGLPDISRSLATLRGLGSQRGAP